MRNKIISNFSYFALLYCIFAMICTGCGGGGGSGDEENIDKTIDYTIPWVSIEIDTNFDDWGLIDSVYLDEENDEDPEADFEGTDLRRIYLARDDDFLYIMFTVADGSPNENAQFTLELVPNIDESGAEGNYITLARSIDGKWSSGIRVQDCPELSRNYPSDYVGVGNGYIQWKVELSAIHFFEDRYIYAYIHRFTPVYYPISDSATTGIRVHLD